MKTLSEYVASGDDLNRVWRVLDLLNSMRAKYYATDKMNGVADDLLVRFRLLVQKHYTRLMADQTKFTDINDYYIQKTWATLEPAVKRMIAINLTTQILTHPDAERERELNWFFRIVGVSIESDIRNWP